MTSPATTTRTTDARIIADDNLTPAMRQYVEQKQRVGDAVLLFRMGDFYETFYDDAVLCANVLGIALTSRNKGENPIPLAGIPFHALDAYLAKLVAAGYRVAISEQMEDPKQAKGVVRRDVVRIVTAGTLTDESLLREREENVLVAVCLRGVHAGLAIIELASGRLEVADVPANAALDELVRLRPAEILFDDERGSPTDRLAEQLYQCHSVARTRRPIGDFSDSLAHRTLLDHFGVQTLEAFGFPSITPGLCAAGAAIRYLQETQRTSLDHIDAVRRRQLDDAMQIDQGSWRSLEIDRTIRTGSTDGTLIAVVDHTVHAMGGRMLRRWFQRPLTRANEITARHDAVAVFLADEALRCSVRERLRGMADLERIGSRVTMGRASPRDLHALGRTLRQLPELAGLLRGAAVALLNSAADQFAGLDESAALLQRAIAEEGPSTTREPGFIADGFHAELDRLRAIGRDGQQFLMEYQRREIERTGIPTLRVGFNRVFGYYIEISHAHRDRAPADYVRRQTVKNAERYITDELKRYEDEVLGAGERALAIEQQLFEEVRRELARHVPAILRAAEALGRLDCLAALAELAARRRYVRPRIVEEPVLAIREGRHPVLDQQLGEGFVPNDTLMDQHDARLFIITGPNMAGKSTYIRQVALLVLMAQSGSFVPAAEMRLGVADRLFARVGSADELSRGQSTFMVEMVEAAHILHHATPHSLVILDELGRGTSTFDGLSLAWAITEHLAAEVGCRTLVATHYHEMTELASLLRGVKNYNVAVREHGTGGEGIAFLYRIIEGGANKSYGIHVARLAGIPKGVIQRSREVLDELQRAFARESRTPQLARKRTASEPQMPLFPDQGDELLGALRAVDPDATTPIDALRLLREWKDRFAG